MTNLPRSRGDRNGWHDFGRRPGSLDLRVRHSSIHAGDDLTPACRNWRWSRTSFRSRSRTPASPRSAPSDWLACLRIIDENVPATISRPHRGNVQALRLPWRRQHISSPGVNVPVPVVVVGAMRPSRAGSDGGNNLLNGVARGWASPAASWHGRDGVLMTKINAARDSPNL